MKEDTHTGIVLTEDEREQVRASLGRPQIMLQCGPTETPQQVVHRIALSRGLPEIGGYYGCDMATWEILR